MNGKKGAIAWWLAKANSFLNWDYLWIHWIFGILIWGMKSADRFHENPVLVSPMRHLC